MGHREQNSTCPVTREEEPRGFLTEWEATPLEPTEDAGNMLAPMWLFDHVAACIRDGKATEEMAQNVECLRGGMEAQAARIAELELSQPLYSRRQLEARAEAAEAEVARLREALQRWQSYGCPDCGGDCASANPPVSCCIMAQTAESLK